MAIVFSYRQIRIHCMCAAVHVVSNISSLEDLHWTTCSYIHTVHVHVPLSMGYPVCSSRVVAMCR